MRLFGIVFTLFPLIFVGAGSYFAWDQQYKLATYVPVTAIVVSKNITSHTSSSSQGGTSTTYKPHVEYRYRVGGQEYGCDKVHVTSMSAGHDWAQGVLDQFEIGGTVEAYRHPDDPSKAYLVREAMFLPYIFVLFPMLFLCIGVGILLCSRSRTVAEPVRDRSGRYVLSPVNSIGSKRRIGLLFTALWWGAGASAFGHFLWVSQGVMDTMSIVAGPIYFGLGLLPLVGVLYWTRLLGMVGDAVVTVDQAAYRPGDEILVEIDQPVNHSLDLNNVEVSLVGEETTKRRSGNKTAIRTDAFHESSSILEKDAHVSGLRSIRCGTKLQVPEDARPTTDGDGYPRITWSVGIHTDIPNGPDYRAKFPVRVLEGADTGSTEGHRSRPMAAGAMP